MRRLSRNVKNQTDQSHDVETAKTEEHETALKSINFWINGTLYTVGPEYDLTISLNTFIRDGPGLKGTKVMCHEGGCGCCTVTVTIPDLVFHKEKTFAINSCLCPLYSCDGWQITTVEGLGSQRTGFHPIQDRLARFNGTQCGYCTPGMVMTMYGLLQEHRIPTRQEVEDNFGGNICRCTGYRPILDAMKSFASDTTSQNGGCIDIEDLNKHLCPNAGKPCTQCEKAHSQQAHSQQAHSQMAQSLQAYSQQAHSQQAHSQMAQSVQAQSQANSQQPHSQLAHTQLAHTQTANSQQAQSQAHSQQARSQAHVKKGESHAKHVCPGLHIERHEQHWYQPHNLQTLRKIIQENADKRLRLVAGNTSVGIYKNEGPFDIFVNLCRVRELFTVEVNPHSVMFGSGLTLTNLITKLKDIDEMKQTNNEHCYFSQIVEHLKKIGSVQVRNVATWAGNLMVKHDHPEFPSDVFTPMAAVGAKVHIFDTKDGSSTSSTLSDFVNSVDMTGKVITGLELFQLTNKHKLRLFKIMPRSQNSYAYLNAGFLINIDAWKLQVLGKPSIVFGGISESMMHAEKTESYMKGKDLTDAIMMKHILELLRREIKPTKNERQPSPEYRHDVAVHLFFKFMLEICDKQLKTHKNDSGKTDLLRPISSGRQAYDIIGEEEWPLKQGMPKLTAALQASGEARYVNDLPHLSYELAGSLVLTALGPAVIEKIDASAALALPGVVDFITEEHIPRTGVNNYLRKEHFDMKPEEIFCSGTVLYAGQVVGIILAETQAQADAAAQEVEIEYTDFYCPLLSIADAVEERSFHDLGLTPIIIGNPAAAFKDAKLKTISGECSMEPLYHFYMENNVALCVPKEDGMDVYATSQWPDQVQAAVSQAIGKPFNYVDVTIPRLGGAFGGKLNGAANLAAATALAAYKTERPVRCNVNLNTNMQFNGLRFPISATYKAGFDQSGKINVVEVELILNAGHTPNFASTIHEIQSHLDSGYFIPNWHISAKIAKTDRQGGQPMRAPGPYPAGFIIESVIEHVARALDKNPVEVKELNLYRDGHTDINGTILKNCTLPRIWKELKKSADIRKRIGDISLFNKVNQWKKKGLTMTPEKYGVFFLPSGYQCQISIYALDGTVSVSQGGVEMGQGLFTKVAQAVAHSFQIPIKMVKVKPLTTQTSPNQGVTAGSSSSEMCVESALKCCEILNERMKPVRNKNQSATWTTIVSMCGQENIDLSAQVKVKPQFKADQIIKYHSYAVSVAEVELDVLTGENQILRVDILFDSGESLNPEIDIGQIEGAYVMGLGGYLLEKVIYDPDTGSVINNGTWDYKPPTTKDIPIDFRIKLLSLSPNPAGTRSSKACGEPPMVLSSGVLFALKQAVDVARKDCSLEKHVEFVTPVAPFTVEKAQQGCGVCFDKLIV
ncbi:xanthine dehydrogenase-like [Gigantopelta aegis]|uniref:xanthine dehydrogenase-like n=1 Tax=Gigantopelta aegis TaxID=1735272 RepID=UPI001B888F16|nr:xanthine dehydrogenase-like [Gigantopelta aegis]